MADDGIQSSSAALIKKPASKPLRGSAWNGRCRLLACTANIFMIMGIYLEYLWAAEWDKIPSHCEDRKQLPWLDFVNCYHRYTFSHSMLRGQNVFVFGVVGMFVSVCYVLVELNRVRHLHSLLKCHLVSIGTADKQDQSQAVSRVLQILPVYSFLMTVAFIAVLLLAPFHLDRPVGHYAATGVTAGSMFMGICMYVSMPLGKAVGLSHTEEAVELTGPSLQLRLWAQRHQLLRNWSGIIVAVHIALPALATLHHFAWIDVTGRLFGAAEVLAILSYQFFVGYLASDDFAMQSADLQDPL